MRRDVLFHLRQEGTLTLIFIHGSGMHKEHCEPTIQRLFKHQFPVWQCWFRGQCWFGRGDRGRRGADRERSGVSTVPIRERRSRSQSRSRRRLPRRRSSCSIAWPFTAVADRTVVYQTLALPQVPGHVGVRFAQPRCHCQRRGPLLWIRRV